MDERTQRVGDLLHETGEVHHVVYRIADGADDDCAFSTRTGLSITPSCAETLGRAPTRSHLVHEVVDSERASAETAPAARWQDFYAEGIVSRFGDSSPGTAPPRAGPNAVPSASARRAKRQPRIVVAE